MSVQVASHQGRHTQPISIPRGYVLGRSGLKRSNHLSAEKSCACGWMAIAIRKAMQEAANNVLRIATESNDIHGQETKPLGQ